MSSEWIKAVSPRPPLDGHHLETVMAELKKMGLTWGEAQLVAKDRFRWKQVVDALCPTWDEEE